jgi:hypothetical protein
MAMIPLMYVELVAAVENLVTLDEEICLCTLVGDHVGLSIRRVEPIERQDQQ